MTSSAFPNGESLDLFEREQLLQALQAREHYLTGVIGNLESFITVDDEWRITFANATAARLAGKTSEELVGVDVREVTPPEMIEQAGPALREATTRKVISEFQVSSADGEYSFRGRAYPLADGGLAVYLHDASNEARTEQQLRESEQRYRELVHSVNSAVLRWNRDSILTFMNEYAERLFGWRREEIVGGPVTVLLPDSALGEDHGRLAQEILERPELHESQVNQNVAKDGRLLWMAWTNRVLRDESGDVREVLAIGNDVTTLVETQNALRESEERFRSLADESPFMIWLHDASGSLSFVNRTYLEFFGVKREAVLGGGWQPLVHPEDRERYIGEFLLAMGEQTPFHCEARVRSASGEWRWIDSHGLPRFSASGQFLGMLGSSPDVTERRAAEAALLRAEGEKGAQQERIRLARDLHDSVTQALFAAALKAEALTAGVDSAKLDSIAEEVRRLNRGALAQMRILLLELRGEPLENVPLAQLLRNLAEATESRASVDVWLSIEEAHELPAEMHVAVYRITQEALNNVARHAQASNAWVTLRANDSLVHLTVRDDGSGFDSRAAEGGHLGLSVMRERAADVGGLLSVETELGRGTLVTFDWQGRELP